MGSTRITVVVLLLAAASAVCARRGHQIGAAKNLHYTRQQLAGSGRAPTALPPWPRPNNDTAGPKKGRQDGTCEACPNFVDGQGPTSDTRPEPADKGLFEELDDTELIAVRDYLLTQQELNLTPYDEANAGSSVIFSIELLPPVKADALDYLDKNGDKPERKALAVLNLLNDAKPRILMVEVGNLPTPSYFKEYAPRKWKNPIHIHDRPPSSLEYDRLDEMLLEISATLDEFMKDQLGGYHYPADCDPAVDKCLLWSDSAPKGVVDYGPRGTWIWWTRNLPGTYLHPVGLDFYIVQPGNDPSRWYISKIWWAKRLWDSPEELLEAWRSNNGDFGCCSVYTPNAEEAKYSTFEVEATGNTEPRPADKRPGSQLFEPYGKRFTINGNKINYMGWEASVGIRTSAGLRLWDIRFKGERIVYEMALQQAASVYGGAAPFQATTAYLDTAFGMGQSHYELVHGVDCPLTAVYMDQYHHYDGAEPQHMKNSVCVFELDPAVPLRRHHEKGGIDGYLFYGGVRSHALVVRVASAVYNYDYMYDVLFYLDGTIETKTVAFGYPQAEKFDGENNLNYGYPMFYGVGGTVHAHTFHWKVDLDVVGVKNSFLITDIKAVKQDVSEWLPAAPMSYKYVTEKRLAKHEEDACIKINPDHPKYFVVVNNHERNKWGSRRGYRVEPMGIINQLFGDDWPMWPGFSWQRHHVVVTKRREDEQMSCTFFEQATPATPVLDFTTYTDGDNIEQEDLVVWLTLGGFHIPLSEDAPNTPSTASHGGFVLRPYNYFDVDAAKDLLETKLFYPDPATGQPVGIDYGMLSETEVNCVPSYPNIPYDGFTIKPAAEKAKEKTKEKAKEKAKAST